MAQIQASNQCFYFQNDVVFQLNQISHFRFLNQVVYHQIGRSHFLNEAVFQMNPINHFYF